jgi:hypothetical protein
MIGLVEGLINYCGKGTRSVTKMPGVAGRVRIGAPDESLTASSGVVAVAELVGRLGVVGALDDAVGQIKRRDRSLSAGEFRLFRYGCGSGRGNDGPGVGAE